MMREWKKDRGEREREARVLPATYVAELATRALCHELLCVNKLLQYFTTKTST